VSLTPRDRALGMDRPITRRDFLDGIAFTAGAAAAMSVGMRGARAQAAPITDAAYPPRSTGLRGQFDGAAEVMHAVRDGWFWDQAPPVEETGEHYDLVVVGAGISGLSSAFLYRQQAGPDAKVLVIDPLDDFGGHAKRNEFTTADGRHLIGYGGSQSIDSPSVFSPAVKQLLSDIGIELKRFDEAYFDRDWSKSRGLARAFLFTKEVFGEDRLVRRSGDAADWVPETPLSDKAKADLITLLDNPPDYLAGKSREEKLELLSKTVYKDFLLETAKIDPSILPLYQTSTAGLLGAGIDAVSCTDAWAVGMPGFDGMDLGGDIYRTMSPSARLSQLDPDEYIYHFPEGNAGISRSLVRKLIPEALPGSTMEDLVATPVDYAKLDLAENAVRIRLNSTVVRVKHVGAPATADTVEVVYAGGGAVRRVTAGHVVLACWNRVIPHLTDELPAEQVAALADQQKVPLIYTNVVIRNWQAFDTLKINGIRAPGRFFNGADIDFPVSIGSYRFAQTPDEPVILHLGKVVLGGDAGLPERDQALAGRRLLTTTTFEEMERDLRDMLQRALGSAGFDAARDIEAITVNRWAHGYAYEYMWPWDAYWPDGALPIATARRPWGRVAIANADSGAYAYAHSAIDQAVRAVRDLLGSPEGAPAFSTFPGPPPELLGL
jgi:spermidine dehydrogenase